MGVPCRRSSHLSTKWVLVFKRISCFLPNHDTAIKPLDGHPINATIYLHAYANRLLRFPCKGYTVLMNGSRATYSSRSPSFNTVFITFKTLSGCQWTRRCQHL
ncbi:hypothetical protein AVEN_203750-1 [Araneus ventricosus]|uniref:Uncharacterized protein n=1 Tax=Araneus ventricosus TaxID=182803 RepID=A0A4Y2GHA1_ARAVE|nr:hypothetical protein AVEN_203750-1 [Araneus ventricosus]